MQINLKGKINYNNFVTIIKLLDEANTIDVTGKDKGPIENVNIKNISMEQYCNIFQASHFTPKHNFELTNVSMDGRYNIIELTDLPKGRFIFNIKNSFQEDDEVCTNLILNKIGRILRTIEKHEKTLLIKNKSHDEFKIHNYDLQKYKVYFLKNISGDTMTPIINIDYNHNNLKLILDNSVGKVIINNISEPRIKKIHEEKDEEEVEEEEEQEIKEEAIKNLQEQIESDENIREGFTNSDNKTCTSTGQIVLIALIIYFVYKLVTKRQTIKLFY